MTFNLVGDDPRLAGIVESSDFHYAITDQFKVVYRIELTIKENVDNNSQSQSRSTVFQFQYMRPTFEKLKEAIRELCRYINTRGASLEPHFPTEPAEPETKPFDQEKSNSYGQSSVTQPYHSPAQIAAAAQGNLHPSFHSGNQHNLNYHQGGPNSGFHPNSNVSQHGHLNGFPPHGHQQQHFGRGYPSVSGANFGGNRGAMNGNRHAHAPHHGGQFQQPTYAPFQQHPGGRGGNGNHMNHYGHFNAPYVQGNASVNGANGYGRRFMHTPPAPAEQSLPPPGPSPMNYQQIPRAGGMVPQSPLDTLGSMELPDVGGAGNGNGALYRSHQEGHTPPPNGGPYSPPIPSYFSPQPNNLQHNTYQQGYPSGHSGPRYQS